MILAGRRINDNMASYVASIMIKHMLKKRIDVSGAKILVMGPLKKIVPIYVIPK